jgi:hypothetical protein
MSLAHFVGRNIRAEIMDVIKTVLAGCGVLALLSVVGCVGLVGAGSYAVDQALEEQAARQNSSDSPPSRGDGRPGTSSRFEEDPFSDYDSDADFGDATNDDGEPVGGWSEESK